MKTARLNRWHRGLAMVIAVPVLLWMLSGLMHPLMAWLLAPPLESRQLELPLLPAADRVLSPAELLEHQSLAEISSLRLQQFDGRWYYRIQLAGELPQYWDASSGQALAQGDRLHAEWLARTLAGEPERELVSMTLVTGFTPEYREINRFLPVWRVQFDRADGLAVYVDTEEQRFASADTRGRRLALNTFALLHNWSFLGDRESVLRRGVVTVLAAALVLMAVTGVSLLVLRLTALNRGHGARRWHRWLGLVVGLSLLGFSTSGLHVALSKWQSSDWERFRDAQPVTAAALPANPLDYADGAVALRPLLIAGNAYWQYQYHDPEQGIRLQYRDAENMALRDDGELAYAGELAERYLAQSPVVTDSQPLTDFRFDYPSVYKRLPVIKLNLAEGPVQALFVETRSGALANEVTTGSRLQGSHFMNLHKYHFLGKWGLNHHQRDLVMSLLVGIIFVLWLAGIRLLWRRYRR